jgi:hypothetical protein
MTDLDSLGRSGGALPAEIPPSLAAFIAGHIDSVELIEVLLLLKRTRPAEWTPEEVSARLYTTPRSAVNRLEALRASGIASVREEGGRAAYRYAPADGAMERNVDDLEREYGARRTTIINLVFSRPSTSIRTFADAFRIREDE